MLYDDWLYYIIFYYTYIYIYHLFYDYMNSNMSTWFLCSNP